MRIGLPPYAVPSRASQSPTSIFNFSKVERVALEVLLASLAAFAAAEVWKRWLSPCAEVWAIDVTELVPKVNKTPTKSSKFFIVHLYCALNNPDSTNSAAGIRVDQEAVDLDRGPG